MTLAELQAEIIDDLSAELRQVEPTFKVELLAAKVKAAMMDVKRRRNYAAVSYTDDQIAADMEQFYSNIRNVALYDYNQVGDEFQTGHTENGVTRQYTNRESLFIGVAPFVGC